MFFILIINYFRLSWIQKHISLNNLVLIILQQAFILQYIRKLTMEIMIIIMDDLWGNSWRKNDFFFRMK
jgi:hypothetical protein